MLLIQGSESMDMSQSQEPTSPDHDAHMVPPIQGVSELEDALQGEVIYKYFVCNMFVDFYHGLCFSSSFCILTH